MSLLVPVRHILTNLVAQHRRSSVERRWSVATLRRPAVITELKVAGETVTRPGHVHSLDSHTRRGCNIWNAYLTKPLAKLGKS